MSSTVVDNDAADGISCGLYTRALATAGYTLLLNTTSSSVAGASPSPQVLTGAPTSPTAVVPGNAYVGWCEAGAQMFLLGMTIDYTVDAAGL
jgi:hypothetical protein